MNDWKFYGEIDLEKSVQAEGDDAAYLSGLILTKSKDLQNETPILDRMDWSYFDKNGFVKYEHDSVAGANPDNIIAVPHERISTENGEFLKSRLLFRDYDDVKKGVPDYARSTVALIKAVQEHNKKFPQNARTVGYSIEGKYLGKSENGGYWGRPINVVISPNPIGTDTYAEISKAHNSNLIKSLMTGATVTPETQVGGAALRKESIQGATKVDFKNKDEAKKYFMDDEGMDESDALQKANDLFPESDVKKSLGLIEKSLNRLVGLFEKSNKPKPPADFEEDTDPDDEEDDEPEEDDEEPKAMAKSLNYDEEIADITPVFTEMVKSLNTAEKTNAELIKSVVAMAAGFEALVQSQQKELSEMRKSLEQTTRMVKAIGESSRDVSFLNLNDENVVDTEGQKTLSKSVISNWMIGMATQRKIAPVEITKFEQSGQIPQHIAEMPEFKQLG